MNLRGKQNSRLLTYYLPTVIKLISLNFSLQDARHSDLWSKYKFICSCKRCTSSPEPYVDFLLNVRDKLWIKRFHHLLTIHHAFYMFDVLTIVRKLTMISCCAMNEYVF
jgi:queuine/archaeosine tRNA-ribosyltransferase